MLGRGLLFMDACLWLTSIPAKIPVGSRKDGPVDSLQWCFEL